MQETKSYDQALLENPIHEYTYNVSSFKETEDQLSHGIMREIIIFGSIPAIIGGSLCGALINGVPGAISCFVACTLVSVVAFFCRYVQEDLLSTSFPLIQKPIEALYQELLALKISDSERIIGGIHRHIHFIDLTNLTANEAERLVGVGRQSKNGLPIQNNSDYLWAYNLVIRSIKSEDTNDQLQDIMLELDGFKKDDPVEMSQSEEDINQVQKSLSKATD